MKGDFGHRLFNERDNRSAHLFIFGDEFARSAVNAVDEFLQFRVLFGIIGFDFAWPLDPGETYSGLQRTSVGDMEFNFVIGQGF